MSLLHPRYSVECDGYLISAGRITEADAIEIANAEADARRLPAYVWRREKRKEHLVYTAHPSRKENSCPS